MIYKQTRIRNFDDEQYIIIKWKKSGPEMDICSTPKSTFL